MGKPTLDTWKICLVGRRRDVGMGLPYRPPGRRQSFGAPSAASNPLKGLRQREDIMVLINAGVTPTTAQVSKYR